MRVSGEIAVVSGASSKVRHQGNQPETESFFAKVRDFLGGKPN